MVNGSSMRNTYNSNYYWYKSYQLLGQGIFTDHTTSYNKPDILLILKEEKDPKIHDVEVLSKMITFTSWQWKKFKHIREELRQLYKLHNV